MSNNAMTAKAPSTSTDQRQHPTADLISTHVDIEILTCADTGRDELIASTDDLIDQQVTPEHALALIGEARLQLDRAAALVARYQAIAELQAFADSLGAQIFEDTPEHRFPEGLGGVWYAEVDAVPTFIFSARLDPATRLEIAHTLVARRTEAAR